MWGDVGGCYIGGGDVDKRYVFFVYFKFFINVAHFSMAGFLVSPLSKNIRVKYSSDFLLQYQ